MTFDLLAQCLTYDDSQKMFNSMLENEYTNEHTQKYAEDTLYSDCRTPILNNHRRVHETLIFIQAPNTLIKILKTFPFNSVYLDVRSMKLFSRILKDSILQIFLVLLFHPYISSCFPYFTF